MPLLSIIIPVYNVEEYLDECIQSILNQSLEDWELILVDDGSNDSSGLICDKYAADDSRIKSIHVENGGQARARNLALDDCTGQFITFVDSDDFITDYNTLKFAVNELQNSPACDIVQFNLKRLENGILADWTSPQNMILHSPTEYIENLDMATLKRVRNLYSGPWAKIYRRKLFDKIRFPEGMFYEDTVLLCDLFEITKGIKIIPEGYYVYRIHEGSTTTRPPEERYYLDRIKMQLRILQSLKQHSKNRRMIGEFYYDVLACFVYACNTFGKSKRYNQLLGQLDKDKPTLHFWSFKTLVKSTIINLLGVKGWLALKMK